MKDFEWLILASDGTNLNCRAYSDEEHLRDYMKLFGGNFAGVAIDRPVDGIISEAKDRGKSEFHATKAKLPLKYVLVHIKYLTGYLNFGTGDSAKMKMVKKLGEASYGGEHGYSDPSLESPTQDELSMQIVDASDEHNADLLISILNEFGLKNPTLKSILLKLEDPAMLADFLRTLISSMSQDEYNKFVRVLF